MNKDVNTYVRGCTLCAISKPINYKICMYTPLLVPSNPWDSVSMDYTRGHKPHIFNFIGIYVSSIHSISSKEIN